jgi:protein-L-isoaspartate(D-aspartate) O-methyltransferase
MALPIACGQTVPEPLFVARMMAGSMLRKDMRVLVIGVGSGYATAVLSHLVRHVVAVDRFKTLASEAEARLGSLAIENVEVAWADGLQVRVGEPFDRILLFAVADPLPESLWPHLAKDGAIVHARRMTDGQGDVPARQVLIRTSLYTDGLSRDAVICPARLSPLLPGLSEVL